MTIKVNTEAGVKVVRSIRMMVAPDTIKRVRRIRRVETGDVLQTIFTGFEPITATIFPSPLYAFAPYEDTVSDTVTANVTGGVAPFTYSWTVFSHSGLTPTITNSTTASPTFNQRILGVENNETAVLRVLITDAIGQTATVDVSAEFQN